MNHRRKIKYIDRDIQGYLMVLLITLETIMMIAALTYLYFSFNRIFEDSIYQIHKSAEQPFYQLFMTEMVWVVVVMSIINFTALFIANKLWIKHINKIINYLRTTMQGANRLDLRFPKMKKVPAHDLTAQIKLWQDHEIKRAKDIGALIQALPTDTASLNRHELSVALASLKHKLRFASLQY